MRRATEPTAVEVPGEGSLPALLDLPPDGAPRAVLSLAHGAGAGKDHPFMEGAAGRLADRGVAVLRWDFPYVARAAPGARAWPPDRADVAVEAVVAAAGRAAELVPGVRVFAGGKSYGGRMTTTAAARGRLPGIRGLVLLGFPLHPPGKPATSKAEHFADVPHPLIFLQGTRDRHADLDLLRPVVDGLGTRATLRTIEAADHGFDVTKRSGRTHEDALDELADAAAHWMTSLNGAAMSADNLAEAFLAAVDDAAFRLESAHGLSRRGTHQTSSAVARVVFEGNGTVLALTCDRGEIDAWVAREGGEESPFRLSLVLGLAGAPDWRTRWPRIIGADTADRSVNLLVDDVVDHAGPWLRSDDGALDRLEAFRDVDLALKVAQFGPGRRPSDQWAPLKSAWESQDLAALVEAVDALAEPLRDVESKARAYGERFGDD